MIWSQVETEDPESWCPYWIFCEKSHSLGKEIQLHNLSCLHKEGDSASEINYFIHLSLYG